MAEVRFEAGESSDRLLQAWHNALDEVLAAYGLRDETRYVRHYEGGAAIGFTAPIDRLYGATEMNEWAIAVANAVCGGSEPPPLTTAVPHIETLLTEEANPAMMALQEASKQHGVPFVWDDDYVSVGMGKHSKTWLSNAIPPVAEVDWQGIGAVPVVLVTGTNGKTTSSRMLTRILCRAGFMVGSTSTDGVCVNEEVVESGDWTGPGAARMVLRRPDVDAAVLETARGGLLRRGIGVDEADVALVTNVGDDHLGDYGVHTIPDMAVVKNLICSVVKPAGARVLNADDAELSKLGRSYNAPLVWFSLDANHPLVEAHCAGGGEAWVLDAGVLTQRVGERRFPVVEAARIPVT